MILKVEWSQILLKHFMTLVRNKQATFKAADLKLKLKKNELKKFKSKGMFWELCSLNQIRVRKLLI